MTAYSEYGGLVAFDATRIATDEPVDTGTVRDGVINNASHLVQSSTQQRANWVAMAGAADGADGGGLRPYGAAGYEDFWWPMWATGPFPVTVAPSGKSAKLVIRIAGHIPNGTAYFRARITPSYGREEYPSWGSRPHAPTSGPNIAEVSTASITPAWLTPNPTYIELTDPADIALASISISMPRSLGGVPTTARVCYCTLDIWGAGVIGTWPILDGVYAREFLG